MKGLIFLFILVTNLVQAEGLYLTPLPPPYLRGMCEKFPDACKKSPVVVEPTQPIIIKPQDQIKPLMSRKTCINSELYYEIISPAGEHSWKQIHDIDGLVKKCKQP